VLISKNGDELDWLRQHVLVLAEQIDKLEKVDNQKYYFTKETENIYIKKRELYEANLRISHLEQVDSDSTQIVMSEAEFRDILYRFNQGVRDRLVNDAKVINMKSYMGFMYIQKIPRFSEKFSSKSSRMPNWNESNKYKAELIDKGIQIKDKNHPDGKNWIIYYTDDYYFRYCWSKKKGACRVKNHTFYSFVPTNGLKGAKKQLINANKNNPFLHKTYNHAKKLLYYPKLNPDYKRNEYR